MQTPELFLTKLDRARTRATLVGALAVLMWAALAPLTAMANGIPPLELLAMSFAIAFAAGMVGVCLAGGRTAIRRLRQPLGYYSFAVAALFGYHALYFTALSLAPPAQASLVAYLWPLLIVLFSAAGSQGERLRAAHVIGAVLGLAGTAILILARDGADLPASNRPLGLLAALGCALTWSGYSVLNRRFSEVPSEPMVIVCAFVAALGWCAHWLLREPSVAPGPTQWVAIAALGVGPVGLAFLAWDHGTKQGHLGLLGTLSYAAPVLSTVLLVTFGRASASMSLLAACALVVAGAWIATTSRRNEESGR
jgi:drug/metabolite transporter (DMT)-like permease